MYKVQGSRTVYVTIHLVYGCCNVCRSRVPASGVAALRTLELQAAWLKSTASKEDRVGVRARQRRAYRSRHTNDNWFLAAEKSPSLPPAPAEDSSTDSDADLSDTVVHQSSPARAAPVVRVRRLQLSRETLANLLAGNSVDLAALAPATPGLPRDSILDLLSATAPGNLSSQPAVELASPAWAAVEEEEPVDKEQVEEEQVEEKKVEEEQVQEERVQEEQVEEKKVEEEQVEEEKVEEEQVQEEQVQKTPDLEFGIRRTRHLEDSIR